MDDANKPTAREHGLGDLMQVAVVVRDLRKTTEALSRIFGIGPFREKTWPAPDRPDMRGEYHGRPASFKFLHAFTQLGAVELEIIQPLEGNNAFADFLERHGEGLHHLRFDVPDTDKLVSELKPLGIKVLQEGTGTKPGARWAVLDTESTLGFLMEVFNPGSDSGGWNSWAS